MALPAQQHTTLSAILFHTHSLNIIFVPAEHFHFLLFRSMSFPLSYQFFCLLRLASMRQCDGVIILVLVRSFLSTQIILTYINLFPRLAYIPFRHGIPIVNYKQMKWCIYYPKYFWFWFMDANKSDSRVEYGRTKPRLFIIRKWEISSFFSSLFRNDSTRLYYTIGWQAVGGSM